MQNDFRGVEDVAVEGIIARRIDRSLFFLQSFCVYLPRLSSATVTRLPSDLSWSSCLLAAKEPSA